MLLATWDARGIDKRPRGWLFWHCAAAGSSVRAGVRGCGEGRASRVLRASINSWSRWRFERRGRKDSRHDSLPDHHFQTKKDLAAQLGNEGPNFPPVALLLCLQCGSCLPCPTLAADSRSMALVDDCRRIGLVQQMNAQLSICIRGVLGARAHLNGDEVQWPRWPIRSWG